MKQRFQFVSENAGWIRTLHPLKAGDSLADCSQEEFDAYVEEFTFLKSLVSQMGGSMEDGLEDIIELFGDDINILLTQRVPLFEKDFRPVQFLRAGSWIVCWFAKSESVPFICFNRGVEKEPLAAIGHYLTDFLTSPATVFANDDEFVITKQTQKLDRWVAEWLKQSLLLALDSRYWAKVSSMVDLEKHQELVHKALSVKMGIITTHEFPRGVCPEYLKGDYLANLAYSKKIPYEMIFNGK